MKLSGIGPHLAIVGGVSTIFLIMLKRTIGFEIQAQSPWREVMFVLGVFCAVVGVIFWISSVIQVKRAYESHVLETKGVYRFSRNPLYAAFIVFIIPAFAFLNDNLLLLMVSVIMFCVFKSQIKKEENFLSKEFGQDYRQYANEVPQLIPFLWI